VCIEDLLTTFYAFQAVLLRESCSPGLRAGWLFPVGVRYVCLQGMSPSLPCYEASWFEWSRSIECHKPV